MNKEEIAAAVEALAPVIEGRFNNLQAELQAILTQIGEQFVLIEQTFEQVFQNQAGLGAAETDGLFGGEVQDAYRRFVVSEAQRLRLRAAELRPAPKLVAVDDAEDQ